MTRYLVHSKQIRITQIRTSLARLLTSDIGPCAQARMQTDREASGLFVQQKKFCDLIVSCTLYILRWYPSKDDIGLWTEHLQDGSPLDTLISALKSSSEFQHNGIYYLEKG